MICDIVSLNIRYEILITTAAAAATTRKTEESVKNVNLKQCGGIISEKSQSESSSKFF